jgi:hypothetical protein
MKQLWKPFAIYAGLDIFCTGVGMGVPILNIQLGFLVGWYLARRAVREGDVSPSMLRTLLVRSLVTVLLTFAMMAVICGPWCKVLWDPTYDYTKSGVPLILYGAKASFIGWMVLMVVISPLLQLLTTFSAAVVTLAATSGHQISFCLSIQEAK